MRLRSTTKSLFMVATATFYVICWSGGATERDKNKLDRLIERSSVVCDKLLLLLLMVIIIIIIKIRR